MSRRPKLIAILLIMVLAVPLTAVPVGAAQPTVAAPPGADARPGDVTTAGNVFATKIHSKLQAVVAAAAPTDAINVLVYALAGTDLSPYLDNYLVRKYAMPNGTQPHYGRTKAGLIGKIASLPGVAFIQEMKFPGDVPKLPEGPAPRINTDSGVLRARLAQLKAGAGFVGPVRPTVNPAQVADWFEVLDPHKSKAAWDLGYTGAGVKVMINDSGIDFGHPDLQGKEARITDPTSPYFGWPIGMDSISMLNLAYDYFLGTDFIASGVGIDGGPPDYVDTRTTRSGADLTTNPDGTLSAVFAPIDAIAPGGYTYVFPATSKSGVYHFGSHPDSALAELLGERAAILVVDETTAGVYDTVYVDLDADYSFVGEKPARKGSEEIYKDLDEDGYPDLSGGAIYWISDGANPVPASDWFYGMGADVAGPGELVLFAVMDFVQSPAGDHGNLVSSAVAGKGVIDGGAPDWKPAGDGTPYTGMVQGAGKDVGLVYAGDFYSSFDSTEGYLFAALGYDGLPGTADDVQIINNSWGTSGTDNDGWDYFSRSMDSILRYVNPTLSDLNSTGNGAPGYGTTNSPGDTRQIAVGASTLYGSTQGDFDSIESIDQIQYNDVMSWSDRGPTAMGDVGVHILANGAWGAGDMPLNETLDGWNSWEVWGGTSKSSPTAAGNLALVYQAFKQREGRWPTNLEARGILVAGADQAYNDTFTEGSGTLNALDSVRLAAGLAGGYVEPDNFAFGDYRGVEYDVFAKIMHQGQTLSKEFTVHNPSPAAVTYTLRDEWPVRIGEKKIELTSKNQSLEEGDANRADYLIDITNMIPAGTQLVYARLALPFEQFEPQDDYRLSNNAQWRLNVLDWTDINGDGNLWTDLNSNGVVNCAGGFGSAACELDQGEYIRFGYGYNSGTSVAQSVKLPLERMHDGIFIAIRHRNKVATVPVSNLKIALEFYKMADFPWLTTDATLTVPAGGDATFTATMKVPPLAGIGAYAAAIRLNDGVQDINVPIALNVAAFSTDFMFGGPPESPSTYDNGAVFGYFDWSWRAESGDWRFYFVDAPDSTPDGTRYLIDTRWSGEKTDLDTVIMVPTQDCFSNGVGCNFPWSSFPGDPSVYGPYTLEPQDGSSRNNAGAGVWRWETSTDGPREIVSAPAKPGLSLIALQNVMFDGSDTEEAFTGQVGTIRVEPNTVDLFVGNATSGVLPVTVQSSLPMVDLQVEGFGMSVPMTQTLTQVQDNPDDPSTASHKIPLTLNHAARLEVRTDSDVQSDLDLFVLYDFNGDGQFDFTSEIMGSSTTSTAQEYVNLLTPPDGNYLIAVHGWNAAEGQPFTLWINAVQGNALQATDVPPGPYQPNTPITFNVAWTLPAPLMAGEEAFGVILAGPPGAQAALEIPVRLHNVLTGEQTETLAPTDDCRLWSPSSGVCYSPYLHVGANDTSRAILKFDLSGINPTLPVSSAKLRVHLNAYSGGGSPADLAAYDITTPWAEAGGPTWRDPWAMLGGDIAGPPVMTKLDQTMVGKWIELDMTPMVQMWVSNPASNNGVLLRTFDTSFTLWRFDSSESSNPSLAPQLIVTYGVP